MTIFEIRNSADGDGRGVVVLVNGWTVINFAGYPAEYRTADNAMAAYPTVEWFPVNPDAQRVGAVLYRGCVPVAGGAEAVEAIALAETESPAEASEMEDETGRLGRAACAADMVRDCDERFAWSRFSGEPFRANDGGW